MHAIQRQRLAEERQAAREADVYPGIRWWEEIDRLPYSVYVRLCGYADGGEER